MIIIYGLRHYGRVDGVGGEFATTKFAHVWYLPLLPTSSMWVTTTQGDRLFGHEIGLDSKSIAAGYLRIWGPILAVMGLATTSLAGVAIAAVAAALSIWSWTWRTRRGPREQRRAEWHRLAFGSACDPLRMPASLIDQVRPAVDQAFAEASDGKTASDVARFGARSAEQAIFAYASLRLVAATARGKAGADARAASERILDDHRDEADAEGGPYRATNPVHGERRSA